MKKIGIFGILLAGLQFFVGSEASAQNKVYMLQMGYVKPIPGRELIPGVDEKNGGREVASTIAVVKGVTGVNVIVDPGFVPEEVEDVDGYLDGRVALLNALAAPPISLTPDQVDYVFISHHHPDHTINAALFPNATVVDFWATYKGDLWEDHPDKYKIAPGIEVRRTPGHTNEDASLVVRTKHGRVVFTHVYWFNTEGGEFPPEDPLAEDPDALDDSRDYVYDVADCIVPGHGAPYPNPSKEGAVCVLGDDD